MVSTAGPGKGASGMENKRSGEYSWFVSFYQPYCLLAPMAHLGKPLPLPPPVNWPVVSHSVARKPPKSMRQWVFDTNGECARFTGRAKGILTMKLSTSPLGPLLQGVKCDRRFSGSERNRFVVQGTAIVPYWRPVEAFPSEKLRDVGGSPGNCFSNLARSTLPGLGVGKVVSVSSLSEAGASCPAFNFFLQYYGAWSL